MLALATQRAPVDTTQSLSKGWETSSLTAKKSFAATSCATLRGPEVKAAAAHATLYLGSTMLPVLSQGSATPECSFKPGWPRQAHGGLPVSSDARQAAIKKPR